MKTECYLSIFFLYEDLCEHEKWLSNWLEMTGNNLSLKSLQYGQVGGLGVA